MQNRADASAILAGEKTLAQVTAERGPRSGQRVELLVMYQQLPTNKLIEEGLYENDQVPFVTHTPSKHQLEALVRKYLPQGFQSLDPQPIKERGATILVTPVAEPQPTVLPGRPIQEAEPTILITSLADLKTKEDLIYNYSEKGKRLGTFDSDFNKVKG
ncbi:MAG: hypothetical protein AAHH96_01535 [Candidatus Symbiodolus clandestinus]